MDNMTSKGFYEEKINGWIAMNLWVTEPHTIDFKEFCTIHNIYYLKYINYKKYIDTLTNEDKIRYTNMMITKSKNMLLLDG